MPFRYTQHVTVQNPSKSRATKLRHNARLLFATSPDGAQREIRTEHLKISRQTDLICWKECRLPSQTLMEFPWNAEMRHHAYGM